MLMFIVNLLSQQMFCIDNAVGLLLRWGLTGDESLVLLRIYHQLLPRSFVKGSFQFSNSLLLSFDDVYARPRHVITGIWAQGRGVAGQRGGQLLHGEAGISELLRESHTHTGECVATSALWPTSRPSKPAGLSMMQPIQPSSHQVI